MATFVLTDASVVVNSTDLSDHVQSVTVNPGRETQDDTVMGNTARSNSPGLKTVQGFTVNFLQDHAGSEVDATIWALFDAGTEHTVVVKSTSAAVGATNPTYTLTGFITNYTPIGGTVGNQAVAPVEWVNSSATGLARATA
jgi:hypothetical protein